MPFDYFAEKATRIKEFLRNHRNVKIRMIMVCIMEQKHIEKRKTIITQDKAYFNSETYINLESADVKAILSQMIKKFWKEFVFIKEMVQVGILKKYSVLKFTSSMTNQLKAQVIFHFQIS